MTERTGGCAPQINLHAAKCRLQLNPVRVYNNNLMNCELSLIKKFNTKASIHMAANMIFFQKTFGKSGPKEPQKKEFISVLEQIDRDDAQALKTYLNQNKKMLLQQFGPEKYSLLHWACFQLKNDSVCSEIVELLLGNTLRYTP